MKCKCRDQYEDCGKRAGPLVQYACGDPIRFSAIYDLVSRTYLHEARTVLIVCTCVNPGLPAPYIKALFYTELEFLHSTPGPNELIK